MALGLQANTSCFYPDGTYIPADQPCINNNGTQGNFCCGSGAICRSDKVCYNNGAPFPYRYVRGSCTDQSFRSSACPQFCLTPSDDAGLMFRCPGLTDSYCCTPDNSGCSCESSNITLAASYNDVYSIAFVEPAIAATTFEPQSVSSSTTSPRTTTPVENPALTLSSSALPSVAVVPSAILTQSTSAASSASSSATLIPSGSSSSSHDSAKEGAAFGAPIAVLSVVIILLVAFLARHKSWIHLRKADLLNQILNSSSSAERSELPTDMVPMDMDVQTERRELEGHTGRQEQAP